VGFTRYATFEYSLVDSYLLPKKAITIYIYMSIYIGTTVWLSVIYIVFYTRGVQCPFGEGDCQLRPLSEYSRVDLRDVCGFILPIF
jgi:hypothetical protein